MRPLALLRDGVDVAQTAFERFSSNTAIEPQS